MSSIVDLVKEFFSIFRWFTTISPWEGGLRIRLGRRVKNLTPGCWWVIPYVDRVYKQSLRTRAMTLGLQTLLLPDGKPLSIGVMIRYAIGDLRRTYDTLDHLEPTIAAMVGGEVAKVVNRGNSLTPGDIAAEVVKGLHLEQFGLTDISVEVTDFVVARTYRLISDTRWNHGGSDTNMTDQSQ